VFLASKLTLVSPSLFRFNVSFTILAMVVLGGMGNIWGVAVGAFIWLRFQEWRMATAALGALLHDLLLTARVYSIIGFEVTPSTVVGLLASGDGGDCGIQEPVGGRLAR